MEPSTSSASQCLGVEKFIDRARAAQSRVKYKCGPNLPSEKEKLPQSERLRTLLPDIWALVRPRRGLIAMGFILMAINRSSGLVLPYSTRYFIDDIIGKRN